MRAPTQTHLGRLVPLAPLASMLSALSPSSTYVSPLERVRTWRPKRCGMLAASFVVCLPTRAANLLTCAHAGTSVQGRKTAMRVHCSVCTAHMHAHTSVQRAPAQTCSHTTHAHACTLTYTHAPTSAHTCTNMHMQAYPSMVAMCWQHPCSSLSAHMLPTHEPHAQ